MAILCPFAPEPYLARVLRAEGSFFGFPFNKPCSIRSCLSCDTRFIAFYKLKKKEVKKKGEEIPLHCLSIS